MKKLLILSGKGGSGKTTTAAAFIRFSGAKAIADCDVDAPNLHLVTETWSMPMETPFLGADKAYIEPDYCVGCGKCAQHCRFGAIRREGDKYRVEETACEGCGVCAEVCPQEAVDLAPDVAGYQSLYLGEQTFSTAQLRMGRGNSGKLVTAVKQSLFGAAPEAELAVIDGSPGVGCPVIASANGVDLVLIVAEPSLSGRSDMERVLKTTEILGARAAVCVNKYDSSMENTEAIERFCRERNIPFVGRVPYDKQASQAVNQGRSIADFACPARDALYEIYENTMALLASADTEKP